jgi:N utilization substance protein A
VNREILEAIKMIEREKGISAETLILALEDALLAAYKKTPDAAEFARVLIDRDEGDMRVLQLVLDEDEEPRTLPVIEPEWPEGGPPEDYVPPAPEIDWSAYDEDELEEIDVSTDNFGRIAAQTAKQVVLQRIREAEREMMFDEYVDRVGDVVTGIIQQSDSRYTLVDLGRVEALLPESEQVRGERYDHGARIKAVIVDVRHSTKGPQVIVSRRSDELIKRLFELEVPEMADGLVEIRAVAREAGWRSKIAVISKTQGVDPVGACVGPRGSRVRMVVSELRGEKIDIIPFNDEPARFVAKALSPARVREVLVDDENRQATVIVPDDQLSLAIGKEGMNARLAARLTGWRIDIKSESTFALEESAAEFGGTGHGELQRCAALLRNGKRCVNAAVPGTRYCSLPAHARLAEMEAEGIVIAADQAVGIAGAGDAAKTPAASDTPTAAGDVPEAGGDVPTEDVAPASQVTAPAAALEADDTASDDDVEAIATISEAVEAPIEDSTSPDGEEQQ